VKTCRTCAVEINPKNKSGLCRSCLPHDAEYQARRTAATRAAFAARPELKQAAAERLRKLTQSPEHAERSRKRIIEKRLWEVGIVAAGPSGSPVRQRAGITQSNTLLAWCPNHLRDQYRDLVKNKGYKAAEARQIILDQDAKEKHRLRVKMGVAAPDCEFNPEPYGPPCPAHLKPILVACRVFKITAEQFLSRTRDRHIVRARHAVMAALRRQQLSSPAIARVVGVKDHTTVLYGLKQAANIAARDTAFAAAVDRIAA
jgi:hypothetical protein